MDKVESKKLVRMGPEEIAKAEKEWDKCRFWVKRKQRFCRLQKISDAQPFCGEHLPPESVVNGEDGRLRERVPCPIDPNHTCFKHLLDQHVKKCNRKPPAVLPNYFSVNSNYFIDPIAKSNYENGGNQSNNGKEVEEGVKGDNQQLGDPSDEAFSKLIEKIVRVHDENNLQPLDEFGLEGSVARELCKSDIGDNAARHLAQIGSILNLMESANLLQHNTAFIEYGGGRGSITYHLAKTVAEKKLHHCRFYVIDKSSPRHKFDNKLADLDVNIIRIRVDIKDLSVASLPGISDDSVRRIVGVAKHLCGHATDMALYSLLDTFSNPYYHLVAGYCFASCCHHRCVYEAYTGTTFLKNHTFTREEFNVLMQISSWATCGHDTDRWDEIKAISKPTLEYMSKIETRIPNIFLKLTIGNFVKNILDSGRIEFSKQNYMPSRVVHFTDKVATLENRALIGNSDTTTCIDPPKIRNIYY